MYTYIDMSKRKKKMKQFIDLFNKLRKMHKSTYWIQYVLKIMFLYSILIRNFTNNWNMAQIEQNFVVSWPENGKNYKESSFTRAFLENKKSRVLVIWAKLIPTCLKMYFFYVKFFDKFFQIFHHFWGTVMHLLTLLSAHSAIF